MPEHIGQPEFEDCQSTKNVGRPKGSISKKGPRKARQLRAYDNEWDLIRTFMRLIRLDIDTCKTALNDLKKKTWAGNDLDRGDER